MSTNKLYTQLFEEFYKKLKNRSLGRENDNKSEQNLAVLTYY